MADTRPPVEHELRIEAPVDAVWKALTDAEELCSWFPIGSEVTPGVGGKIKLSWGKDFEGNNKIKIWEPNHHLQTGWFEYGEQPGAFSAESLGKEAMELSVDYFLEGEGGHTKLRLVHSGFHKDARWDEEYSGVNRGWTFELRSLRHYLERHRGKQRRVAWVRVPTEVSTEEAWDRFMGAKAFGSEGKLEGLKEGDRYAVNTVHGDKLEGVVQMCNRPTDFAGTVENMDASLVRYGFETCFGQPEAMIWFAAWGMPQAEVDGIKDRWTETLQGLYAA